MICLWMKAKHELPKNASANDILALGSICHQKCPKKCGAENENGVITYTYTFVSFEQWAKMQGWTTITC